ncbi:hypothetical protein evm_006548 [Chilo suppressalis]|nr:hypothetical protein evm_006548 [Chilo suppressalis]
MDSKPYPDLTCVLFPGIVKNTDKAIQCLGGIRNISQVYSESVKKLGLSYRPEDPYLKKMYADCRKTAGLLVKVRVKKHKIDNELKKEVISTEVVGQVKGIYRFESICDFQYLPIQNDSRGVNNCILDQIFPSGLDAFEFMNEPGPIYIVPSSFSRTEKPYNYAYTNKKNSEKIDYTDKDLIAHRRSRSVPLVRYKFSLTNELPSEPNEHALKRFKQRLKIQPQMAQEFEFIKKMLQERPILSYNMIRYQSKYRLAVLKIILPTVAVHMHEGPWKKSWVRFGYDPRKIPESRIYQTLDFRVRHTAGMNVMVMKRKHLAQYKKAESERRGEKMDIGDDDMVTSEEVVEAAVYFRPGIVPAQRQMYYQLCDVKLPEVEELLAKEPPPGYLCHQTWGWLPPNTDQLCRDYISKYMKDTIFASNAGDELKIEKGSSDDESDSNSDEAEDTDGVSAAATGDEMT